VTLDPSREVLGLIGSKEGLFNFGQAIINPGDYAIVPDPGYPVYSASTTIAGGKVYALPILPENQFLPDLESIPVGIAEKAKILWLNYPNNPTGAVASFEFLEKVIAFAKKYQILVAFDAPYTDICFDNYQAPSILQVPGAKEVAVEFNSLSKTYNMAGWRLGMAVGSSEAIQYLHTYKSQMDSSGFEAVLEAGITALTSDQSWIEERNQIYQYRRDIVVKALRQVGFTIDLPAAAIYVWAKIPAKFDNEVEFCAQLLEQTGVSLTPGSVYGEYGKGYLRVSLGSATDQINVAMNRIIKWLS